PSATFASPTGSGPGPGICGGGPMRFVNFPGCDRVPPGRAGRGEGVAVAGVMRSSGRPLAVEPSARACCQFGESRNVPFSEAWSLGAPGTKAGLGRDADTLPAPNDATRIGSTAADRG